MPFVVSTKERFDFPDSSIGRWQVVSRVAVATLGEARMEVLIVAHGANRASGATPSSYAEEIKTRILEAGGTVGPLPDGTTIEVEDLSLVEMYRRAGFEWDAHGPDAMVPLSKVLAAFNEADR